MLFNQTRQDRMRIFEGILFLKATHNTNETITTTTTTAKQQQANHLSAASWVLAEECVHETKRRQSTLFQIFFNAPKRV